MFSRYSNGFKQMKIISTQSNPVQILTLSIGRLNSSKKAAGIQDGNYLSADSRHEVGRCNGGRWRWLYDSTCLLNLGKYKKRKTRSMIAGRIAPLACGYWLMKHQVRAVVMRMELPFSIPSPLFPNTFIIITLFPFFLFVTHPAVKWIRLISWIRWSVFWDCGCPESLIDGACHISYPSIQHLNQYLFKNISFLIGRKNTWKPEDQIITKWILK